MYFGLTPQRLASRRSESQVAIRLALKTTAPRADSEVSSPERAGGVASCLFERVSDSLFPLESVPATCAGRASVSHGGRHIARPSPVACTA